MQLAPVHRKLLLWCGLALMLGTGVLVLVWPREPRYDGKPLSFWVDHLPATILIFDHPVADDVRSH